MKIQLEVTQKMKLYNVYRLCKQNVDFFKIVKIGEKEELNAAQTKKINIYTINNWLKLKDTLDILSKIPVLTDSVNGCIQSIPDSVRNEESPRIVSEKYDNFISKKDILYKKMQVIIDLYESMKIEADGNGIDIKLPHCEDLKDYISYLKDIDFIFSQCPFLQCEDEVIKFGSVDVGSNWLKLTVAAASTCFILTNTASLVDKALILRSHYITVQQQEEMLKIQQLKNELTEAQIKTFDLLRNTYMNIIISQLEKESEKSLDPEERDKAERTLEKLIILLDKGCEIYATLDAPEEVQALFPEIQGNLELPDDILKYLEDKGAESE